MTDLAMFIRTLRIDRETRKGPSVYASDKVFALLDAYEKSLGGVAEKQWPNWGDRPDGFDGPGGAE